MKDVRSILATTLSILMAMQVTAFAASHREAPLTALDHAAVITDFYSFRIYDDPTKITFILNVDPLLEPANGPNYFPFDPSIVYAIHVDNTYDAARGYQPFRISVPQPPSARRAYLPASSEWATE